MQIRDKKKKKKVLVLVSYEPVMWFGGIRRHSVEKGKIIEITQWPGNTYQ